MCNADFDVPAVSSSTMRRARVPHHCVECRAGIAVGERYEHATSLYDGAWSSWDSCAACAEMARVFVVAERGRACWTVGDLAETIVECDAVTEAMRPHLESFQARRLDAMGEGSRCTS